MRSPALHKCLRLGKPSGPLAAIIDYHIEPYYRWLMRRIVVKMALMRLF